MRLDTWSQRSSGVCQAAGPEFKERMTDPKKGGLHRSMDYIGFSLVQTRSRVCNQNQYNLLVHVPESKVSYSRLHAKWIHILLHKSTQYG